MTNYIKNQPWKKAAGISVLFLMALTTSVLAAEAGADSGVEKETMWTLIKKGGPIMIPLGIASIIALALALERFISLNRDRVLPNGFLKGLGEAWGSDPSGKSAEQYCEQSTGSAAHVFKAGLQWRDSGHEAVAKAIEDAGIREADKLKRSLRGLSIIAAVSPLLGLLGTVYGMIDAFQRTSQSGGAAKTADLATGIYEALVTTAAGLTIAIPALLLYQFLQSRVDKIIDHIDEVGTDFIVNHARERNTPADHAIA